MDAGPARSDLRGYDDEYGLEPRQEPLLGLGRAPGRQIILPGRQGQAGIAAEQAFRLGFRKARKFGRLEIGRAPVGGLDLRVRRRPSTAGSPKRIWIAESSRFSTAL